MGILRSTFYKHKDSPMVISVGEAIVFVNIDWTRTRSTNQIHFKVEAPDNVEILIPSTFTKLKGRIQELERTIEELKGETKN